MYEHTLYTLYTQHTHTYTPIMSTDNKTGSKRKQAKISKDSPDKNTCNNGKSNSTRPHSALEDFIKSKFESLHSAEQTLVTKLC